MDEIIAKRFEKYEDMKGDPGDYVLTSVDAADYPAQTVFMYLPCGHGFMPNNRWQLQDIEDENKITLSPSIFCSPQEPCWHGFLREGKFIKA